VTRTRLAIACCALLCAGSASWVAAQQNSDAPKPETSTAAAFHAAPTVPVKTAANVSGASSKDASTTIAGKNNSSVKNEPAAERIEGEKRYHANCGRCHMAPQKFPPRAMATIVRHMRVRATITDDDMRLILKYMTQ